MSKDFAIQSVLIFGAGSIGSLLGYYVKKTGKDVILIGRKPHMQRISVEGLTYISPEGTAETLSGFRCYESLELLESSVRIDLIIVTTKAWANEEVAVALDQWLRRKNVEHFLGFPPLLLVQNGLGNEEPFEKTLIPLIFRGVLTHGAHLMSAGVVKHAGRGWFKIGLYKRNAKVSDSVVREITRHILTLFNEASLYVEFESQLNQILWEKLAINAVINPVCALYSVNNGFILEHQELFMPLVEKILVELVAVAASSGIRLKHEHLLEQVRETIKHTWNNKCSMLQDLEKGRQTEIDNLNGHIVILGKKYGIATPVNETLTVLVKGLERKRLRR